MSMCCEVRVGVCDREVNFLVKKMTYLKGILCICSPFPLRMNMVLYIYGIGKNA